MNNFKFNIEKYDSDVNQDSTLGNENNYIPTDIIEAQQGSPNAVSTIFGIIIHIIILFIALIIGFSDYGCKMLNIKQYELFKQILYFLAIVILPEIYLIIFIGYILMNTRVNAF